MAVVSSYTDSVHSPTDALTYTFSGRAIGSADAARYVLVAVFARATAAAAVDSLTVGGITATLVAAVANGNTNIECWIAAVPTGTTADVVVNWTTATNRSRCGIALWKVVGLGSVTAFDTMSDVAHAVGVLTGTIDCEAAGAIFAAAYCASTGTWTWAGVTERYDFTAETGNYTGAHDDFASAQSGLTVTATSTNSAPVGAALLAIALSPPASGHTGAGAVVLAPAAIAAQGGMAPEGAAAISLGGMTVAASALESIPSAGALTFAQVVLAAAASEEIAGAGAIALDHAAIAAQAIMVPAGEGVIVLNGATLAAAGDAGISDSSGAAAISLFAASITAAASLQISGAGVLVVSGVTLAGSASEAFAATGAVDLAAAVLAGSGLEIIAGTGAVTLEAPIIASAATLTIDGIGAITLFEIIIGAIASSGAAVDPGVVPSEILWSEGHDRVLTSEGHDRILSA